MCDCLDNKFTITYFQNYEQLHSDIKEFIKKSKTQYADTFAAVFDNQKIIGIGSLYKNKTHPHCDYINIFVEEHYRKLGCGKLILNALKEKSELKKIQCMFESDNTALAEFLISQGFMLVRKCFDFDLKPCFILNNEKLRFGVFKKIADISPDEEKELAELIFYNYTEYHKNINPLNPNICCKDFYTEFILPYNKENSSVYFFNGKLSAYMIIYDDDEENNEAGYIGGKNIEDITFYLQYYKYAIKELLDMKKTLFFEIDDVNNYGFALMKELKIECNNSYDTYIGKC